MRSSSRPGFTLLEVLVAVAVLGLVAAGALRLAALAERTLAESSAQRRFVADSETVRTELALGTLDPSGSSGDLTWDMETVRSGDAGDGGKTPEWKEALIRRGNRSLTLCVP
jgi:prepilin-type N-terminal cleavage/methylation domain-containing protein